MANPDKSCKKTSRLAILSLLLTIVFPWGLILAIVSFFIIVKNKEKLKGLDIASIAILINIVGFCSYVFVVEPTTKARQEREKTNTASYNLKLVGKTIVEYSKDNNGHLPLSNDWCDVLLAYDSNLTRDNFKHPAHEEYVIAYNQNLSGKNLEEIPSKIILLFEAKGGWNLSGDENLINTTDPNRSYIDILYSDLKTDTYWLDKKKVKSKSIKNLLKDVYITPLWEP